MTEHLAECPKLKYAPHLAKGYQCCCQELRACEQRLRESFRSISRAGRGATLYTEDGPRQVFTFAQVWEALGGEPDD